MLFLKARLARTGLIRRVSPEYHKLASMVYFVSMRVLDSNLLYGGSKICSSGYFVTRLEKYRNDACQGIAGYILIL